MKRRRPTRKSESKSVEPTSDDELEFLEPLEDDDAEELDTLEEWEGDEASGGAAEVTHEAFDGADFDLQLTVTVAEGVAKKEVADAIEGPLRAKCNQIADAMRWQRVVVEFAGEALIPTVAKQLVGEILAEASALSGVVRRGFGDERVHDGEKPSLETRREPVDGGFVLHVDPGELAAADVRSLLRGELDKVAADASGQRVAVAFGGGFAPDADLTEAIRSSIVGGGAARLAVRSAGAESVLHDAALADLLRISDGADGYDRGIEVGAGPDGDLAAACELTITPRRDEFDGQRVSIGGSLTNSVVSLLVDKLVEFGASAVAARRDHGVELLHPKLLSLSEGRVGSTLMVDPAGRSRDEVIATFAREISDHADALQGKSVTIDWPAQFEVDESVERQCVDAVERLGTGSIAYTVAGQDRIPVRPAPIAVDAGVGSETRVRIDTDAGKPAELVRALEQRLGKAETELSGRDVEVSIAGDGTVSRSMRQALVDLLTSAGVRIARIEDHGERAVLLPSLLKTNMEGADVQIDINPAGRSTEEIERDAALEIEAAELSSETDARLVRGPATDAVLAALIGAGVRSVSIDGQRVHPRLFEEPQREDGGALRLVVAGGADGGDEVATRAQVEHELSAILEASGSLDQAEITLAWEGATKPFGLPLQRAIEMLVGASPQVLRLERAPGKVVQVHPEPVREFVVVLGRKDNGVPPMIMLGIDVTDGEECIAEIEAALGKHQADYEGRRVLLVFRDNETDVVLKRMNSVVVAVRAVLEPKCAALLIYGERAKGTHFDVVHSTLDTLPVGTLVRDPRPAS